MVVAVAGCLLTFAAVTTFGVLAVLRAIMELSRQGTALTQVPVVTVAAFKILDLFLLGGSRRVGPQQALAALGDGAATALEVVRRYREEPSPLARDRVRGWRPDRVDRVLAGDFDLIAPREEYQG